MTSPIQTETPKYSSRREDYLDAQGSPIRWGHRYHDPSLDLYYLVSFPGPDKRGWMMLNVSREPVVEFLSPDHSKRLVRPTCEEYWNGVQAQAEASRKSLKDNL